MPSTAARPVAEVSPPSTGFWPEGWWRIRELRIGIIPVPVFILLAALIVAFVVSGTLPNEINVWIGVLALLGFLCAEIGKRVPILRNIGGAAICATFIPSFLAYHHLLPAVITKGVTDFTKSTSFLYLFIAAIIVGSILSMDRKVLIKGFLKIFVPLAVGSIAACIVGTLVGTLLGLGRLSHVLLRRDTHHGRRHWRRGDSLVAGLRQHPASASG